MAGGQLFSCIPQMTLHRTFEVDKTLVTAQPSKFRELLAAVMEGSEEAAWELTELYSGHIIRAVRASLPKAIRSKVDSLDFLQSMWASILLEPVCLSEMESPKQFIAFLVRATQNKVIDKHRHFTTLKRSVDREVRIAELDRDSYEPLSPRNKTHDQIVDRGVSPSRAIAVREAWQRVVKNSSPRDQQVVAMRIAGKDYQAIATSLGINQKTVQRTLGRMIHEFQQ